MFNTLGTSFDVSKYQIFKFARINRSYSFGRNNIRLVTDSVTNLGLKLSYNLDLSPHIKYVWCEAFKMLGFHIRLAKDFRLSMSVKELNYALV